MKKMMFIFLNGEFWHYCTVEEKFNSKDLALLDLYEKIGGEPEDNKFYIDEDGDFVVEKEDEDGLECEFYNTGNVQSAYLDGDLISNSSAKKILMHLAGTKVWYDVKKNCFDFKVDCASDEYAKCIVENLKEKFMKN